jgi:hypothetical protein
MGLQSVKVPQPEFSQWVIKRRQELNLSPANLKEKIGPVISERTLKYLEDGKKNSYSEYTMNILATGLDLSFPELLKKIEELKAANTLGNKSQVKKTGVAGGAKSRFIFFASVFISILFFSLLISSNGIIKDINHEPGLVQSLLKGKHILQDVLIHPDYPRVVVAYDGKGNILWQKNLRTRIRKVARYDLDGNGRLEVIAATWRANAEDDGELPGWLYVWNKNGDLLTEFNTWKPSIYPAQEPRSNVVDFQITDLENDGVPELVVAVRGEQYYPSRVSVLHFQDSAFKEINSYWNPGYLLKLYVEDVNNDGFPEIICTGVNNDLKRVREFKVDGNLFSIFLLDGRSIFGQAPPYLGQEQVGSEVWYRYITTPGSIQLSEIVDVTFMGEKSKEIHIILRDTCFFYLDYLGDIVDLFSGDHCTGDTELHLISKEKTK